MKELLKREDSAQSISFIDEITNDSLIGIMWPSGNRCIPVKNSSEEYTGITKSCSPKVWTAKTKKAYVLEALSLVNSKIYLFKSEFDLIKWCFSNE